MTQFTFNRGGTRVRQMPRPKPTYKHTHAHTHQQRRRRANSGDTGQRNETERNDRTAHTLSVAHAITVREELMMRTVKRTHWRFAAACARVRRLSQCARRDIAARAAGIRAPRSFGQLSRSLRPCLRPFSAVSITTRFQLGPHTHGAIVVVGLLTAPVYGWTVNGRKVDVRRLR